MLIPERCRAEGMSSLMLPLLPHRPWGRRGVPGRVGIRCSWVHVSSTASNGKHLRESPATPSLEGPLHAHQQQPRGTRRPVPNTCPGCRGGQGTACIPGRAEGGSAASQPFPVRKMGRKLMERAPEHKARTATNFPGVACFWTEPL